MKSLERRFNNITKKNLNYSSYLCFVETIKGGKFDRRTIRQWFDKLVDKDDYDQSERKDIIKNLSDLTNMPEDNQK